MIKINEKLTVLHDNNSIFADLTNEMIDFTRGTASLTFITAEDSIYIGFSKPINTFFVEMSTVNANSATMTLKYYNGTAFTAAAGFFDDTNALFRSGFVSWDRNQTDETVTTINTVELFWYKLDLNADSSALVLKGLNIVYSDDQDLKREIFEINKFLPSGETSHILSHVAARDEIIQSLRADGRYKEDLSTGRLKDITAFDLLDISQVKLASTYLVLAKIYMASSDSVDDIHMVKHGIYRSLYNGAMKTMYLNIDEDNDGISDYEEELGQNSVRMIRR